MYECERWTLKKAESWRIDAFKLWLWRRLLRVPWAGRRPNQSILKETNTEYSFEGRMLKLQYYGHLMWRADSLEKTLMLGKTEGRKRRGRQSMRWLDSITDSMNMNLISLLAKGLLRVFSITTVWKHRFFGPQPSWWFNSYLYMTSLDNTWGDFVTFYCGIFRSTFSMKFSANIRFSNLELPEVFLKWILIF